MTLDVSQPGLQLENVYGHRKRLGWLSKHLKPGDRIVEVGCGTGYMITLPLLASGYDITGIDRDEASIIYGRDLARRAGLSTQSLFRGDVDELAGPFDVVIVSEVLEHLDNIQVEGLLKQVKRIIRPNGFVLITVPNGFGWFEFESFLWNRLRLGAFLSRTRLEGILMAAKVWLSGRPKDELMEQHPASLDTSPHVQRFTRFSLLLRVRRAGFVAREFTGSTLFAGQLSNLLFTGYDLLTKFNNWLGERLPSVASGFYLACIATEEPESATTRSEPADDLMLTDAALTAPQGIPMTVLPLDEVATLGFGQVLSQFAFRHRDVCIRTPRLELMRKPLNKAILLRLMARRRCWVEDEQGAVCSISPWRLYLLGWRRIRDGASALLEKQSLLRLLDQLEQEIDRRAHLGKGATLYLRADPVFGIRSGGSVGHIAGVLNQLNALLGEVRFFTTELIPTVDSAIDTTVIQPGQRYADMPEVRSLLFGKPMAERVVADWQDAPPRFIYQRYAANNITGLLLARHFNVPLVIEYNGSEVWINRHWGKALQNEELALRMERLNLLGADLVVVVSQPLADQLLEMGIPTERILVNPNGVDPQRYRPGINCDEVRDALELRGQQVIGFIGTFGPWHGAEMLAEAAAHLLQAHPELRERLVFLLIGDGQTMPRVREIVEKQGIGASCRFTGLVPQEDGPVYMAACDILVSPHVPNPDGTPFFGSPTKLFEYLAMGKPVIASELDQIAQLLTHEHDAVLVPPGDIAALADAILALVDDPECCKRLGEAARATALQRHTWQRHTERIIQQLDKLMGVGEDCDD